MLRFREIISMREKLLKVLRKHGVATSMLALRLAAGNQEDSPFTEQMVEDGVEAMLDTMGLASHEDRKTLKSIPKDQPFRLYLLATLAQRIGDPDWKIAASVKHSFATGVPVGVGGLPRTPAVYERKKKWRTLDASDFSPQRENYSSAIGHEETLEQQFKEEELVGMCYKVSNEEAARQYPGKSLRVASIGAIEKADHSFRIIHDATRGVHVNNEAVMRDRTRRRRQPRHQTPHTTRQ